MTVSTREADAAFADLICADPQWLDAEFDALIAASFGQPPAQPPPAPPRVPPSPGSTPPPSRGPASGPAPPRPRPPPGRDMAGSARLRRISPADPRAAAPRPPDLGAAARMTATSTGHCPAGPGKENGQGITEPNPMASDTRRGSPAGSPAVCSPGLPAAGSGSRPSRRRPRTDSRSPTAPAASWLAAAWDGRGAVVADLLQPDGDVRHQDQVVIAQDHFTWAPGRSKRSARHDPDPVLRLRRAARPARRAHTSPGRRPAGQAGGHRRSGPPHPRPHRPGRPDRRLHQPGPSPRCTPATGHTEPGRMPVSQVRR